MQLIREVFSRLHLCRHITQKVTDVSTHIPAAEGFDDSLETGERCTVSKPVFKHNSLCSSVHHKKCGLGSFIISTHCSEDLPVTVSF